MLSNTAKMSGADPKVAITIPKRCNLANRPIGYKCGRMYILFPIHLCLVFSDLTPLNRLDMWSKKKKVRIYTSIINLKLFTKILNCRDGADEFLDIVRNYRQIQHCGPEHSKNLDFVTEVAFVHQFIKPWLFSFKRYFKSCWEKNTLIQIKY